MFSQGSACARGHQSESDGCQYADYDARNHWQIGRLLQNSVYVIKCKQPGATFQAARVAGKSYELLLRMSCMFRFGRVSESWTEPIN